MRILDSDHCVALLRGHLDLRGQVAEIDQVFVHPRYRRWGIGTQLIRTCAAFGREKGVFAVQARVPVSNPGWTVYLKAGFRISGFTTDYVGGSAMPDAALLLTLYPKADSPPLEC